MASAIQPKRMGPARKTPLKMREAPLAVSSAMLVAWPILRLASPSVGFVMQVQAYYGGSAEHCGVHSLFITLGYIAMNAYFLTLIWRRHQRNRDVASGRWRGALHRTLGPG